MRNPLLILSFIFAISSNVFCQLKPKDLGYNLSNINKRDKLGKQGVWIFYEKQDSSVLSIKNYTNDTLNGNYKNFWYNGNISEEGLYINGKFEGKCTAYWENGKVRGICFYKDGLMNGLSTYYDINGIVTSKTNYINGVYDSLNRENYINPDLIWDNKIQK